MTTTALVFTIILGVMYAAFVAALCALWRCEVRGKGALKTPPRPLPRQ